MKIHNDIIDLNNAKLNEKSEKLRIKIVKLLKCDVEFCSALVLIMAITNFVFPLSEIIEALNVVLSSVFFNVIFCINFLVLFYYLIPFIICKIKLFKNRNKIEQ